jgi:outer membrane protein OmpA-like peptidoglycan-associated protein
VHYIDKKFSEPINLGAPTNSEFNDLTVTEIGNVIYFCSDRDGGKGSTDIYTILLSPKIFNVPDTGFKFTATEKESGRAVSASFRVSLGYADAKKKAGKVLDKKSGADGRFDLKVDPGVKSVRVTSGDARFKPYSKSFTAVAGEMKQALVQLEKREEQIPEPEEDLIVEAEPPVGDYRPVYFNFGSARIRMKEMPYLREIAKKLRADDTLCLRLTGHADSVGRESGNQRLSVRRAVAVKSALIHFGVSRYRFSVAGKGEREPSDLYKDTGKRRYNRRVEFTVIDREQVDDDEEMP